MSKIVSVRLTDDDLDRLAFLSHQYYGSVFDNIRLPLSPVIRACVSFAYDVLQTDPDLVLSDPALRVEAAIADFSK